MISNRQEQNARQRLSEVGRTEWRQPVRSQQVRNRFSFNQLTFFAGGAQPPTMTARQPGTRFAQNSTQFVYFQVEMVNPWRTVRWTYRLCARLYHPDGALMGEVHDRVTVDPACETFWYTGQWGSEAKGQWSPGGYRVEICVDEQETITGNFAIAADPATQLLGLQRLLRLARLHSGR